MKSLICMFLLIVVPASATADGGVLGLKWGDTVAQVRARGVHLTPLDLPKPLVAYSSSGAPVKIPGFTLYGYTFLNDKLVKVSAASTIFNNDPYGTRGKAMFKRLETALKKKYKITTTLHRVGLKLYTETVEFYQCLNYPGCGAWGTLFTCSTHNVILELSGMGGGKGGITLQYEAAGFSERLKAAKKKSIDKLDHAL